MKKHDTMKILERAVEALKRSPKRVLSVEDIREMQAMPWARDARTIRKMIELDAKGERVLAAKIVGLSTQKRYAVQRAHLIKYLRKYGPVLMHHARKPKQLYGNRKTSEGEDREGGA